MDFEESRTAFLNDLRTDAATSGTDTEDEFIERIMEMLTDIGELQNPQKYYFQKTFAASRVMGLNGYGIDDIENSLSLIISDFEDTANPPEINRKQIEDVLARRLRNFLELSCNGNISRYCDDSDEILSLARMIQYRVDDPRNGILKFKFYVITNKKLSDKVKKLKEETFLDKPVEIHVWHIERIIEQLNASSDEPIIINTNDYGVSGVPFLKAEIGDNLGYDAYIAILPGKLLADIYIDYGSRLLEENVRAFLGASGQKSVNAGIRHTIKEEPAKFFTYNNGIAATAARIETVMINGKQVITELENLQIINGGQTTASLANAVLKKDSTDLVGIFVPAKITIISDRETITDDGISLYDNMVQKISRYANSQNKVTAADFFSNSPFHVVMERLSKSVFAPPVNGSVNPTGWYYERARKKYDQEQIKFTKAQKEKFQQKYPKKQVITKEKLAKYMFSLEGKPHIVSKGNSFVMREFGAQMDKRWKENKASINEFYFKKAVGAAIIFNTVDDIVAHAPWYQKGYPKLNIVPYTISKIVCSLPKSVSLDWGYIWRKQALHPAFIREIEIVSKMATDFIMDCGGMIVTEYCKKEETWKKFLAVPYTPSVEFCKTIALMEETIVEEEREERDVRRNIQINTELEIFELGGDYWTKLLEEGKRMRALSEKDISLLNVAISATQTGKLPSTAQARAIMEIRKRLDNEGIFVTN